MRWRWVGGVVAIAVFVGAAYLLRRRALPPATSATYLNPAVCANCHSDVWQTYRLTGMGRSFHRPVPGEVKPASYYHKPSDSYFTMQEHDGHLFQRRYQIGFDGKETNSVEKQIDYVVGSGNHVRAYLHRTSRNTLVELPLALYAEKGGSWAMNPGYDRPDHAGFTRSITNGCMFCHNGYPDIVQNNANLGDARFPDRLPEGIDCQRCHGPGSRHVELAEEGSPPGEIQRAIVNPARLSPERQMEVCMQCHLETTSARLPNSVVRFDRAPYSYRPGEALGDFMLQFDHAPGTGRDDKFEIAGAAYRLRKSACFQKSEGALRCTTCHNPHDIPRGEAAAQHYTAVCRNCHDTALKQTIAAGKHTESADCIGCHMPKRRTDDVVHVAMTDHFIQRRKPQRDLLLPLDEKHDTEDSSYRGEVILYYPHELSAGRERDLYLAAAQVAQKSNLLQGIPAMAAAIEKYHPEQVDYYLQLGDAYAATGQVDKAISLYEEAARRKPDSLMALRQWGFNLRLSGQIGRAIEILKRALEVAPSDSTAWHELGLAYVAQHSRNEAIAALQKAADLDEDSSEPYNSLGGVWLESRDLTRAEPAFREAIRRQPDYAEAHSNLANVLSASRRFAEASYHFEAAIRLKPDYADARFNYALALARVNRFSDAQRQIEAELRFEPRSAEAHDLLGNLLIAQGKTKEAAGEFEKSIQIRPEFGRAQLDLGSLLADAGDLAGARVHLAKAAASSEATVREEATRMLERLGAGR